MYWRVKFTKSTPKEKDGAFGEFVEVVTFFTSSPVKKENIVSVYTEKGFLLEGTVEVDDDLPLGYEDQTIRSEWWFPKITN